MMKSNLTVGVVQATPVLFDLNGTLDVVNTWLGKSVASGCSIVLFPESFIPCYPRGLSFDATVGKRTKKSKSDWLDYWNSSIMIGSDEFNQLRKIIASHGVFCGIGVTEKSESGSLYCSLWYFNADGEFLGSHRKLKPTGLERYVWAEGSGKDLITLDTEFGKVGGLICWENYMPGARWSMYNKGVEIYMAPTADARESWQSTMIHVAREGRCFVLASNQFVSKSDYPEKFQQELLNEKEIMSEGGSVIIDPYGEVLAGPLWNKEGLLVAELKSEDLAKAKLEFDAVGHYARNDIFQFSAIGQPDSQPVMKHNRHEN